MNSHLRSLCRPRSTAVLAILAAESVLLTLFTPVQTVHGETVADRLWIWGHPAGVYNDSYLAPLAKTSSIEPVAAAQSMGLLSPQSARALGRPGCPARPADVGPGWNSPRSGLTWPGPADGGSRTSDRGRGEPAASAGSRSPSPRSPPWPGASGLRLRLPATWPWAGSPGWPPGRS